MNIAERLKDLPVVDISSIIALINSIILEGYEIYNPRTKYTYELATTDVIRTMAGLIKLLYEGKGDLSFLLIRKAAKPRTVPV